MNGPRKFIFKRKRNFCWSFFVFTVPLESLTLSRYLRLKFPSKFLNVNLYWNERDWSQRELENSKFHFEKIANLLSKFYYESIVLTKSYPTSRRCPYFAFWEACKKYCAKNRRKLSKNTLSFLHAMDIDHSLDSSSWVQSICNKILITNSQFFQMKFWIF